MQVARSQRLILNPLSALLSLFPGPQKLIQKRYDKLLDCNSSLPRSAAEESDLAKREYEALNAQLVEELQAFNQAARKILLNCLCSFITLLRDLMLVALQAYSTVKPVSTALPLGHLNFTPPSECRRVALVCCCLSISHSDVLLVLNCVVLKTMSAGMSSCPAMMITD